MQNYRSRLDRRITHGRQNTVTVFPAFLTRPIIGHRLTNNLGKGREYILQTNQSFIFLAGRIRRSITNAPRLPSYNKGDTVSTFERGGFVAPERACRDIAILFRPIVTGENDQRIVDQLLARIARIVISLQPVNHASQSNVILINVVISRIRGIPIFCASRAHNRNTTYRYISRMRRVVGIRRIIKKERAL